MESKKAKRMMKVRISKWNNIFLMGSEIALFHDLKRRKNRFINPEMVTSLNRWAFKRLIIKDIIREHLNEEMELTHYEIRSDITWKNL